MKYEIFWIAVSAIATLSMAVATFVTLLQSRRQLNELKRQWELANKPELIFKIIQSDIVMYLEVKNNGNSKAFNICLGLDGDFYNLLKTCDLKRVVEFDENCSFKPFEIHKGESKYFPLSMLAEGTWSKFCGLEVMINGEYNNRYKIAEKMTPANDCKLFDNPSGFDEIATELKTLNENIKSLSDNKDNISSTIQGLSDKLSLHGIRLK